MKMFTKALIISTLILPFSSQAWAAPETYTLDSSHTNITWHANHFGFSTPSGKFVDAEGTLVLDEAKPENSKVNVKIKPARIITGIEKFDEHLKGKDFFDVKKFPDASFVSNNVEVTGKDTAKIHGILTLHGVSKPVTLNAKLNKIGEHPMNKKKTVGFSATTTIKRSDFGISYGIPNVSDKIRVDIEIEASVS